MENIRNSGVSGNRITSKYTYLGNSPEFRVVLESCERILTIGVSTSNSDIHPHELGRDEDPSFKLNIEKTYSSSIRGVTHR